MEEKFELKLEELEKVAGGSTDDWTAEERARYQQLYDKWYDAGGAALNGTGSKADSDAAWRELMLFVREMHDKYGA